MAFKDYWTENGLDKNDDGTSKYAGMRPGHDVSEGPAFSNAVAYIKIDNLEEAAVRIKELGQVACTGLQILMNFDKVIEGLKEAWQGSDAVVHINNLIGVKKWCAMIASTAEEIASAAWQEMQRMNEKQIANGGKDANLGSISTASFGDHLKNNAEAIDSGNVFVDTDRAREYYQTLLQTKEMFADFSQKYMNQNGYVMEIWQSGGSRDWIESNVEKFRTHMDEFSQVIEKAASALNQAIINWES